MVHSWARSADDPVAMFSLPPSFSAGSASQSSRRDGRARESVMSNPRSRTPSRSGREIRDATSVPTSPAPAWTTGHVKADAWVSDKNLEQEVLSNLASVPQAKRLVFQWLHSVKSAGSIPAGTVVIMFRCILRIS